MPKIQLNSSNISDYIEWIEITLKRAEILDEEGVSQAVFLDPDQEIPSIQIAAIEILVSYVFDFKQIIQHNEEAITKIDHYAALDALQKYYDPARHIEFYKKNYPQGTSDEVILEDLAIKAATLTTADLIRLAYTIGAREGEGQQGIQRQHAEHYAAQKFSEVVNTSKPTPKSTTFFGKLSGGFFSPAPVITSVEAWLDAILEYRSKLSMAASSAEQIQKEFKILLDAASSTELIQKEFKDSNAPQDMSLLRGRAINSLSNFYQMLKELKTSMQNEAACERRYLENQIPSRTLPSIAASPQFSLIAGFEVKLVEMEHLTLELCFKTLKDNNANPEMTEFLDIDT
ncbi:MAG: hypothetical protein WBE18_06830, partial [Gammaproteobacteria bacterium]